MSYKNDKGNPFGGGGDTSLTNVDKAIFGDVAVPSSGRVVAKPVQITDILPDLRQPRRAIPASVRGEWDGSPEKIGDLLTNWKLKAQRMVGVPLDNFGALLMGGEDFPPEYDEYGGIVDSFVELVRLAQRIYAEGLQNPITIYEDDGQRYILTGERRYLAHHLLYAYVDRAQWGKIAATVVDYSVRQQISENTARRDLNAIGLARCYAMIVMELYREDGKAFCEFDAVVKPGACDRAYYAQVVEKQVPYGKMPEVLSALNVQNRKSVFRYKILLTLPDEVWITADEEDWSLRRCMEWIEAQKPQPSGGNVAHVPHSDGDRGLRPVNQSGVGQTPPPNPLPVHGEGEQLPTYNPSIPSKVYPNAPTQPTPPAQDDEGAPLSFEEFEPEYVNDTPVTDDEYVVGDESAVQLLNLLINSTQNTDHSRAMMWFINLRLSDVQDIDEDSLEEELSAVQDAMGQALGALTTMLDGALDMARAMQRGEVG